MVHNWTDFLTLWNRELLERLDLSQHNAFIEPEITPEMVQSGWLGFAGASQDEIAALETRLDTALPPSYRAFLTVSNGFRQPGMLVPRLYSTQEVDWLRNIDLEGIEAWRQGEAYNAKQFGPFDPVSDEEYFVYGEEQNPLLFRSDYLFDAVRVSAKETVGTAVYLLNPQVKTDDGEWEAWLWAHWIPGAYRYRSFWDLIQAERRMYLQG